MKNKILSKLFFKKILSFYFKTTKSKKIQKIIIINILILTLIKILTKRLIWWKFFKFIYLKNKVLFLNFHSIKFFKNFLINFFFNNDFSSFIKMTHLYQIKNTFIHNTIWIYKTVFSQYIPRPPSEQSPRR